MRRFLLISLAILSFLGVVSGTSAYVMAGNAPFVPGDWLFPAQLWSEQQWGLTFNQNATDRAVVLLNLLERRLNDLEAVRGSGNELAALTYLDAALDQAAVAVGAAPEEAQAQLHAWLSELTGQALALMDGLDVMDAIPVDTAVIALLNRFQALRQALTNPDATAITAIAAIETNLDQIIPLAGDGTASASDKTAIDSHTVPFPEGSVDHSFFPLMGGHATVNCETCHTRGRYEGTNPVCVACHAKDEAHDGVYGTNCATCHNINNWQDAQFDHNLIGDSDCSACHNPPQNHYQGACRACHSDTTNFRNAFFNHATIGSADCSVCHSAPANHYAGVCRDCHNDTSNFRNASFNHATIGNKDCSACHSAPANHYAGACRDCHSDTNNFKNASFDHASIGSKDCSSCHTPPQNHYAGACRDCHSDTNNFKNASFNHANTGNRDCNACHNPPQNHYSGACRDCHQDTNNFKNATFNHATIGNTDCSSCHNPPQNHYSGTCRDCHQDTNNFNNATFNHSAIGNTDCSACHSPPSNHYPGECRACHQDTNNFKNVNFSHQGLPDCQSCHAPPQNHFQGQCSDCHNTDNWGETSFNHTFPMNHKDANGDCSKCHPGGDTSNWTCANCHSPQKMDEKHQEVNGYSSNCLSCHANGKKPND